MTVSQLTEWLYGAVAKPAFFLCDPEFAHVHLVQFGKELGRFALTKKLVDQAWAYHHPVLAKTLNGIMFPNPVGLSAGFDYNADLSGILPAVGFGFHTVGTITLRAYPGNPRPRLGRFPQSKALLVNKGLKNDGARAVIKRLTGVRFTIPTGISIASTNQHFASEKAQIEDITDCFKLFEKSRVKHAYYELNISCPNTFGGEPFSSPTRLEGLLTAMDTLKLRRPMYIKMPIDQSEKESERMLRVIKKHRVDGLIIGNLTKDKTNPDVAKADRVQWQTKKGNVSGKPTWKRSNRLIALARQRLPRRFTIIGTGGIFSPQDAQKKMALGADLVQLITGMVYQGPQLIGQINYHLAQKSK